MDEITAIIGKTIANVRVGGDGFDLVFTDGSEIEIYCHKKRFSFVLMSAAEAAAEAEKLAAIEAGML